MVARKILGIILGGVMMTHTWNTSAAEVEWIEPGQFEFDLSYGNFDDEYINAFFAQYDNVDNVANVADAATAVLWLASIRNDFPSFSSVADRCTNTINRLTTRFWPEGWPCTDEARCVWYMWRSQSSNQDVAEWTELVMRAEDDVSASVLSEIIHACRTYLCQDENANRLLEAVTGQLRDTSLAYLLG
ncbi:MAG: hypothetical protein LBB34_02470 [Holosporales bacterium]|nr:hypothetical protein [Holosporales bacterium]